MAWAGCNKLETKEKTNFSEVNFLKVKGNFKNSKKLASILQTKEIIIGKDDEFRIN
jgi:hypothetical protein